MGAVGEFGKVFRLMGTGLMNDLEELLFNKVLQQ